MAINPAFLTPANPQNNPLLNLQQPKPVVPPKPTSFVQGIKDAWNQAGSIINAPQSSSMGQRATSPSSNVSMSSPQLPASMAQKTSSYTGPSIVDYLGSKGQASDFASRAKLAQQYGIQNYSGTADQNTQLLNELQQPTHWHVTATSTQQQALPQQQQQPQQQAPQQPSVGETRMDVSGQTQTFGTDGNWHVTQPQAPTPQPTGTQQPPLSYQPQQNGIMGQMLADLGTRYTQPSQAYTEAVQQYNDIKKRLTDSRMNMAKALAGNEGTSIPLEFQQGRARIIQNQYLQEQNALAQELAAAGNLIGQESNQQQLQQQALGTAAGLAAPIAAQALGFYNPASGTYSQYGGGAGGGIGQASDVLGRLNLGQSLPATNLAFNQASGIKNDFENWLQQNKSALPSDSNLMNKLKSWALGSQFSDPRYPQITQFLNEYMNTISQLMGAQSSEVTDFKQSLVNNMINPTSGADSIIKQINGMHALAGNKLVTMNQAVNQPYNPQQTISNIQSQVQNSRGMMGGGTGTGNLFGNTFFPTQ